jgi:hypothetical protein
MKRETTVLAVFCVCGLVGCATHPKIEYADGPGPYAFDCEAHPGYYEDFHIHAPSGKLRLTGLVQVVALAEHPDPHWVSGINVNVNGQAHEPLVGLAGRVSSESRDAIGFYLRWGLKPSQQSANFAVVKITDVPIPFELTLSESRQLTVSVGGVVETISVAPLTVVRANLSCSGAHVRYSNVVVSAE